MITIDYSSGVPPWEQLVNQLRYRIVVGHFKVEDLLPSTRTLAEQVGVSFHTVRKAYRQLQEEGLVDGRSGRRFRVVQPAPLDISDRIERGASIVAEGLQKLVGLGLNEREIEYLLQEQLDLIAEKRTAAKVIFAAPYRELAIPCARQIAMALQLKVYPVHFDDFVEHVDTDYAVARFSDLGHVMGHLPRADVLGVTVSFAPSGLARIARMLPHETLGLVTRFTEAIEPLTRDLRTATGYAGQVIAASIEAGTDQLTAVVANADSIVFTPPCERRLRNVLTSEHRYGAIAPVMDTESINWLRQAMPA